MLKPIEVGRLVALLLVCACSYLFADDDQARLRTVDATTTTTTTGTPAATCGTSDTTMWAHPRLVVCGALRTAIMTSVNTGGPQATAYNSYLAAVDGDWATIGSAYDINQLRELAFILNIWQTGPNYLGHTQADFQAKFLAVLDAGLAAGASATCNSSEMQIPPIVLAHDWTVWTGVLDGTRSGAAKSRKAEMSDCAKAWSSGATTTPLHHRFSGYRFNEMWYGLSFKNDAWGDSTAATNSLALYSTYITHATAGHLAMYNFFAGTSGGLSDGFSYTAQDYNTDPAYPEALLFFEAYRTAYGDASIWTNNYNIELQKFPQVFAYLLSQYTATGPCTALDFKTSETDYHCYDGTGASIGGSHNVIVRGVQMFMSSSAANDASLAKHLETNYLPTRGFTETCPGGVKCWYGGWGFWQFLNNNPAGITAKSPSTLGLATSKQFDKWGLFALRTGWGSTDDTTLYAYGPKYYMQGGQDYLMHGYGHVQMSRGAPLLVRGGGGIHHTYEETSLGSNVANFVDPNDTSAGKAPWDYGGQREGGQIGTATDTSQYTVNSIYDVGGYSLVDLYAAGGAHDYDYLWGDFTRGYNGPAVSGGSNTSKVDEYDREVAFFHAANRSGTDVLCVTDHTDTTSTSIEQRITWHFAGDPEKTEGQPTITGHSGTTNVDRDAGAGVHNHTSYTGATGLSFSYSGSGMTSGKLWGHFLFPSASNVVLVGGPNGSSQWLQTDSHEFEGNHANQFNSTITGGDAAFPWAGQYRVDHVNGGAAAQVVLFMSCWEAAPAASGSAATFAATTGTSTSYFTDTTHNLGWVTKTGFGTNAATADFVAPASSTINYLISRLPASTPITLVKGANVTSVTNNLNSGASCTSASCTTTAAGTLWVQVITGSGAARTVSW